MQISEDQRRDYLKEEYLFLQAQYEDYDNRSLTIKGWIGTGAVGVLVLGVNNSGVRYPEFVPIVTAVVVCIVWYLETYWKLFQHAFSDRIRIIEAYFRSDPDILDKSPAPFQIYSSWTRNKKEDEPIYPYELETRSRPFSVRLMQKSMQPFVCLPYLPILILCAASLVLMSFPAAPPAALRIEQVQPAGRPYMAAPSKWETAAAASTSGGISRALTPMRR